MNERTLELYQQAIDHTIDYHDKNPKAKQKELDKICASRFSQLIVEETLKQVDERTCCRGETSWYNDDKDWVRLHFGYGKFTK